MRDNPLTSTSKPFLAKLLNDIAGRALETYEQRTGLSGVKEVFHPMVGQAIVDKVGDASFPDEVMTLGARIFDWFSQGKFAAPRQDEPVQQPVQQASQGPSMLTGAPIPGFTGRMGRGR